MHKNALAVAACAALTATMATPAAAQVTGVITHTEADLQFRTPAGGGTFFDPVSGNIIEGSFGSQTFGSGGSFASTSIASTDYIYFKNGNAGTGAQTSAISKTLVDITFKNDGSETVVPTLQSQIVPAGFGIFVGPGNCPNDPSLCNPDDPLTGSPPRTFDSFNYAGPLVPGQTEYVLASASFEFRIYANDFVAYELTGDLSLVLDTVTGIRSVRENIFDAQSSLTGFTRESEVGSQDFIGFQWDTTDILVNFAPGTTLAPGESATLTYETIVQSTTRSNCFGGSAPGCLISYSSFGDPISRGGGGGGSTMGTMMASASDTFGFDAGSNSIGTDPDGILFGQFAFLMPQFKNGTLTYVLDPTTVPEPDSWALMIGGFGLVGASMRRRRRLVA